MQNTLKKEFEFYKENQSDLLNKYRGKFIVIKDKRVVGAYDSEPEAYAETIESQKSSNFLIQEVDEGEDSYSGTLY